MARAGTTKAAVPPGTAAFSMLREPLRLRLLQQPAALVVPALGDARQLLLVLLAVVGAEEELAAVQANPDVGLRAAAVATVRRGQRKLRLERVERSVVRLLRHVTLLHPENAVHLS